MRVNDMFRYQNVSLPEDILRRKYYGDFEGAIRLIDLRLQDERLPEALHYAMQVHREMMMRMPTEFPHTYETALKMIQDRIPDFTKEEFDRLLDERRIRWLYINGEMRLVRSFFATLIKAYPGFAQRAGEVLPGMESAVGKIPLLDASMKKMKETGAMTNRIRIRATLQLKDEQFKQGMFVRAHLPIPAACGQQSDIRIEKVFPANGQIAPEDAPQRTVCWEENMEENHEFAVEYSYTHTARYHDAQNLKGEDVQPDFCLGEEEPHIVFTPYIRALAEKLTAGVTDPMEKARRIYDYITLNMHYTFVPNYFQLEKIAETCALNFNGDCGVFALLFITLCRCAGVPAQWQSGLTAEPDHCGCHDWAQFYVAPYGWLYADPSFGIAANRNGNEERRQFYFGNLDPYRMVANGVFQAPFTVRKDHWRADPYDNQVGEIESADHGFLYSEYDNDKQVLLCEEVDL